MPLPTATPLCSCTGSVQTYCSYSNLPATAHTLSAASSSTNADSAKRLMSHHSRTGCPLLQASFRQWQLRHALPQLEQRLEQLTAAKEAVDVPQEEQVRRMTGCCAGLASHAQWCVSGGCAGCYWPIQHVVLSHPH
jgi:hypothetical protein